MSTIKQKKAAQKIMTEKVRSLGEVMREVGYSEVVSKKPKRLTESKGFKEEIEPFLDRLVKMRSKILKAMEEKNLSKERFTALSDSLSKITHDIQLLSGEATENNTISIEISEAIAKKNQ